MQLHVRAYGDGRPLLILHGLFGSLDNWHSISVRLGEQYRVYAFDLRNHGRSPHDWRMDYPVMVGDLMEWMAGQGLASVTVMGHSMGGKVAMEMALSHPEAVERLVVVDISPKVSPARHDRILDALLNLDLDALSSRKEVEDALAPSIPDLAVRQFLLKSLSRSQAGGFKWTLGLREIAASYSAINGALASGRQFTGPALFVRGDNSAYLVPDDLDSIRENFPRAQLSTIPNAGHWVHAEAPRPFLEAVENFLALASPEATS